jgi:hypothetical protein
MEAHASLAEAFARNRQFAEAAAERAVANSLSPQ